ncbi:MAG: hypothetical protein ABI594_08675 [Ginsengibacter sp.]
MEQHFTLTDNEFEKQFQNCLLDPAIFTHEAHLRLAWIHIRKYGADIAIGNIRLQLQNFVDNLGARNKYNETVTIAAVKAVFILCLNQRQITLKILLRKIQGLKIILKSSWHFIIKLTFIIRHQQKKNI